jgi:hypothetical protein
MYYLIYKTTNIVNNKIYIGCHKTEEKEDGYLGSGKVLRRAILKYGIKNFTREILECYDNSEEMFKMEAKLVNEDFIKDKSNYNLKIGGVGGFDYINSNIDEIKPKEKRIEIARMGRVAAEKVGSGEKGRIKHQKMLKEDSDYREWFSQQCKNNPSFGFRGKEHSIEAKIKIGNANSIKQKGKKNSQYGTCWIHSPELKIVKKIKKEELNNFIEDGWKKGRKLKE